MFESKIDPRSYNTSSKDPFLYIEGNNGLELPRPFIEGQEVDGCESIDTINRYRDEQTDPKISVCEDIEARTGFEIIERLS
jgi:hypothetical protein